MIIKLIYEMRGATIKILYLRFYTLTFSLFNINFTALQYSTKYQNKTTQQTPKQQFFPLPACAFINPALYVLTTITEQTHH